MRNLERVDPGFDARNVLLCRVDPTLNHYDTDRIRRLYSQILDGVRALPGVERASFSHRALVSRSSSNSTVHVVDGVTVPAARQVNRLIVDPGFFRTMRIPLLAGATFSGLERASDVRPVVINHTCALQLFHAAAPLGHRFRFSDRRGQPTFEVIGVAGDVAIVDLRRQIPPTVYFSYLDEDVHQVDCAIRAAGAPHALVPAIRRVVTAIDAEVPIDRIRTQEEQAQHQALSTKHPALRPQRLPV
jgi:MacB-like periplasmic core domain